MKKKLLGTAAMLAAGLCAVITAGMFLASCDYWGEDWYKAQGNGPGRRRLARRRQTARRRIRASRS